MLRRVRARRAEERSALREEPPAPPESPRADSLDRTSHRGAAGASLGRRAGEGGRAVRSGADVRSGLQRSAPERARLLSRGAAREARGGEADRLADAHVGDAAAALARP